MDANGDLVVNADVSVEISILQGSVTGNTVYMEDFEVLTSELGHFSLEIGRGMVSFGQFDAINWSGDDHFASVAMDVTGGTNYSILGVVELVAVPYAFVAMVSASGQPGLPGQQGLQGVQAHRAHKEQKAHPEKTSLVQLP